MKYLTWIIALIIGGVAGFAYWYFIGCNSGSCAITSSPINSSIYGAVLGMLLVNTLSRDRRHTDNQKTD